MILPYDKLMLMIQSEDFVFVKRPLASGSKNIYSNSDDLYSYISAYIFLMFRSSRLFKYIYTFLFSRQKKYKTWKNTNDS